MGWWPAPCLPLFQRDTSDLGTEAMWDCLKTGNEVRNTRLERDGTSKITHGELAQSQTWNPGSCLSSSNSITSYFLLSFHLYSSHPCKCGLDGLMSRSVGTWRAGRQGGPGAWRQSNSLGPQMESLVFFPHTILALFHAGGWAGGLEH